MTAQALIENVKILNVVQKSNDDGSIKWYELVFMQGSDINTVTVTKEVADQLEINENYDLLLQISEVFKSTVSGRAFKSAKFKIVGFYDVETE